MPIDAYSDLIQARSASELLREMSRSAASLDFERFSSFILLDRWGAAPRVIHTGDNVPAAYLERSRDPAVARVDPANQLAKRSHRPFTWDLEFYRRRDAAPLWEESAPFGYRTGIVSVLHMPKGRHFLFGVSRHDAMPRNPAALADLLARVHLLCSYAHEAAARLYATLPASFDVHLSAREAECLRWTINGKTVGETGRILSLSESSISKLLGQASRKLGCTNKHQAALRALQLGIIEP